MKAVVLSGVATVVAVSLTLPASGDFEPGKWAYVKDIILPPDMREEGLVEIVPDAAVYAGASRGLADIRILADDGTEIAYVFEVVRGQSQTVRVPATVRDVGYVEGEYDTLTVDFGTASLIHNRLEILTSSTNFDRDVIIESSKDETTWAIIAEESVYDFTLRERGVKSSDTVINYPETASRYLRVKILDDGEGPLDITGANIFLSEDVPPRIEERDAQIIEVSVNDKNRVGVVDIDLGSPGLPSHAISLEVGDVNFYRVLDLESSTDGQRWRRLASQMPIYVYDTPKFVGGNLSLSFSETTDQYFRLTIYNEDNAPIQVDGVSIEGIGRRIVFSADPLKSYSLYYGNQEARRPSYDIERIFPFLETEGLARATLGSEFETSPVEIVQPVATVSEGLPWLIPVVIAFAVVMVGAILFGILKQAKSLLPPPPQE